jgi:poly(3-hydroxybutyrate) depolymerase
MRRGLVSAVAAVAALAAPPGPATASAHPARWVAEWPCSGCAVELPAGYSAKRPAALLVALHGDEGSPALVAQVWGPLTAGRNVILFAPHCPVAEGCSFSNGDGTTSSWWGWLQSGRYDDGWLDAQVNAIAGRYRIDRHREYLTGWSGGADFLGYYALRHAGRFAAAAFVAGGVPYYQQCPPKPLPVFFLAGSNDFRWLSGQPAQVRSILSRCGASTPLALVDGADHQQAIMALQTGGYGAKILSWLLGKRR